MIIADYLNVNVLLKSLGHASFHFNSKLKELEVPFALHTPRSSSTPLEFSLSFSKFFEVLF